MNLWKRGLRSKLWTSCEGISNGWGLKGFSNPNPKRKTLHSTPLIPPVFSRQPTLSLPVAATPHNSSITDHCSSHVKSEGHRDIAAATGKAENANWRVVEPLQPLPRTTEPSPSFSLSSSRRQSHVAGKEPSCVSLASHDVPDNSRRRGDLQQCCSGGDRAFLAAALRRLPKEVCPS
ncbi:unnamed protein product [Lactuca saligna]|uniref:Uncharacterized protein n=1 Tax=Lactuca saligna TaxID=75948 RepID=A0AA36A4E5_LACSI|nr:unnamed protein product [Lactuca saligna]